MAERRMFAKTIIDSDAFLEMPLSTQCLYFHLNMRADDEGFVNNPKKIARMINASTDDLKILLAKSFILEFESGVIVIKHWKLNNYIRGDRYHPTVYVEEKARIAEKENGSYTFNDGQLVGNRLADGRQMVGNRYTEVSIGKDSLGKDSIGKNKRAFVPPTLEEVEEYAKQRNSNVNPKQFYEYFTETNWTDTNGKKVRSWKGKFITWEGYRTNGNQPVVYEKPEIQDMTSDDLNNLIQRMKEEGQDG